MPQTESATRTQAGHEFIEACSSEPDTNVIVARFLETLPLFGFQCAAGGAWAGTGGARVHRFYFNNWPKDWFELYDANNFAAIDPMLLETRRRMSAFLWSEVNETPYFQDVRSPVMAAVRDYGWSEVMAIPIHGPASYQALVTMASLHPVTLTPVERALLRVMAIMIHDRAHATAELGIITRAPPKVTPREQECMNWVAAGKTDAEIGIILGISAATAHFHIEHVKKKLGTRSRTEAVGLLLLAGMI
jgi:DNA-binding CsgD family transcriptional regulator